ncbi:MAG: hypothetical protein US68_C0006G0058 [Candidatus Shapirobacteria bacterium GW2011_GWE1_38_10]|uniref:Uncharacterized protein n=1 Tax=Candidatus Shapirobacteria bacterium GW2011_GWE1_38_10 TaxID=1618488 RepID=A0A0G0I4W7_9BACT|nr:MAG: hypothetical protein US46_C0002G0121 [Candidatus Shapirobacteria bacterium GW2011_GWF2_37_20]KKQ50378.1 MAG: hypothetical protein US68_C0006G0058 [Candidatus Shapirobacteria bacterium GW2011_GWE1_38_10]KKQ65202.1 MAG: hypothetical protein US85_C0001G0129 [Candidatus Shapirobacteria bacterium GW2011_GWF1_38_23]
MEKIEQQNSTKDPLLSRLHKPTFVQEVSQGDIFHRKDGRFFLILAISNNNRPVIDYQAVKCAPRKINNQITHEYSLIHHQVGIMSSLRLRRLNDKVIAYTHSEDELTKITHIQEKSLPIYTPRKQYHSSSR